ncbi:sirohydrochlorin chelatase [Robertmurraya massiliosenegalensis]|uniref:sirohydrochlorin chelatase n=1 Tax=Robertmurraya TaxID=2837507 RepID=UPI0039A785B8
MKAVLFVGHGTRSKKGAIEAIHFIESIMEKIQVDIQELSFLELTSPTIDEGFLRCVERGATEITVVPILLLTAGHMKKDIPEVIRSLQEQYPHINVFLKDAFGVQEEIIDAMADLVLQAVPDLTKEDALLIVGRGSSEPDVHNAFSKIEKGIQTRLKFSAISTCYLAAAKPTFQEGLENILEKRKNRVIVIPYLLFSGLLLSEINQRCKKFGTKIIQVEPLSRHDAMRNVVVRSVLEVKKCKRLCLI